MKKTISITGLQNSPKVFAVGADNWNADVVKGQSIRIHGTDGNRVESRSIDRTYKVGDRAAYDSYNLIYVGTIVSITDKTVTIDAAGTGEKRKRLPLAVFFSRNRRSLEAIDAHNAVER